MFSLTSMNSSMNRAIRTHLPQLDTFSIASSITRSLNELLEATLVSQVECDYYKKINCYLRFMKLW